MTTAATARKAGPFGGDGVSVNFDFAFKIFATTDVVVTHTSTAGVETVKVLTTNYTVAMNADQDANPGGRVTMLVAPAAGEKITLSSAVPESQGTVLPNAGNWNAKVVERALDKVTILVGQVREVLSRVLRQPISDTTTIGDLPTAAARRGMFLAFEDSAAAQPIASSGPGTTPVSVAMSPVVSAASVNVAVKVVTDGLTEEDVPAPDDLLVGTDISAAGGRTFRLLSAVARMQSFGGALIVNGKITRSVAGSALTVALKTLAGNDPTASAPVYVLMPTVTSNVFDGGYAVRKVTAALSTVVSSGSTLGHIGATASPVYTYLIDNAGALELATSNKFFGGASVQSSTAEGGAGAADSPSTLYSTTARANVAIACLQRWKSTQAVAGTWAATTGEVQLFPFPYKKPTVVATSNAGGTAYTKPWDMLSAKVTVVGAGASGAGAAATGGATVSSGGGGGAGGAAIKTIAADVIGPTETMTVGAGGAGVAGAAGNGGGTSSFGAHCSATGGTVAQVGGPATSTEALGGVGGVGTSGDLNIEGAGGGANISGAGNFSGHGGSSILGGGGRGITSNTAGVNGGLYGGAGSGASNATSQGARAGGTGANGVVCVEEFYS